MPIIFRDMLYGEIILPDWLDAFIRMPEFVRLRRVSLSNVDSIQFKDFAGPSRWEHCIAVAFLASYYADICGSDLRTRAHLMLSGLLHDVATPPFGHTVEYVLENFDHEAESQALLEDREGVAGLPSPMRYRSEMPRFRTLCQRASKLLGVDLDSDEIARMVVGDGELGSVICGSLDLDNADNVTRACLFLGLDVNKKLPLRLVEWLAAVERIPDDLSSVSSDFVQEWLEYRDFAYRNFFFCSSDEMGRQAFLQHLLRRAFREGLPRKAVLSMGDSDLLRSISVLQSESSADAVSDLAELVDRYQLLDATFEVLNVPIEDRWKARILSAPRAVAYIEERLASKAFEPFVMVALRREGVGERGVLFPPPIARLLAFKLGRGLTWTQLPAWLRQRIDRRLTGKALLMELRKSIAPAIDEWIVEKPWLNFTRERRENLLSNLNAVGSWAFRLSKNEPLHWYPSTFVHAIPASLISSLGLRGELVVDCFGGTGQTAVEAVRQGGSAISLDSNLIACKIARASLTYLSEEVRSQLARLSPGDLTGVGTSAPPRLPNIEKWFHQRTLDELCRIMGFVSRQDHAATREFLLVCFSAILASCTGRRGKEHAYFADNTPLPRGVEAPAYVDAYREFSGRVRRNVAILDKFYGSLARQGRDVRAELERVRVERADIRTLQPEDVGLEEGSLGAIITSPPYLCTIDYSLGHRLSYAWLAPDELQVDHEREIGARRRRFSTQKAQVGYFEGITAFARFSARCLRNGGVIATVLGCPTASRFKGIDVLRSFDEILAQEGFELVWSRRRAINWQRNFGLQSLKSERVAVHVLR